MAVAVLIESGIALKLERLPLVVALQFRGFYSQREKQPWPFLAGRSHDDSERFRILSDAVWSLPRPHSSTSIGPSLTFHGEGSIVKDAAKRKSAKSLNKMSLSAAAAADHLIQQKCLQFILLAE
jgi:hypothetical protein